MKIAMVGSGYVGLVSGACFADFGHDVICIDKDPAKIEQLNAGKMPIYEPGLDELVSRNARAGRLAFTNGLADGITGASAIFVAVGTPSRRGDGHAHCWLSDSAASRSAWCSAVSALTRSSRSPSMIMSILYRVRLMR